jgi:cytoskeletal protein CcmA (bactofilin family)
MFSSNNKSKKESPLVNNLLNIIGTGTKVHGDLASDGDIRVDGTIEGFVNVKQRLVLGEAGVVVGDIEANEAIVSGLLRGNIKVDQMLILKSTARIEGDIVTDKIVIESGAHFNGRCSMNVQLSHVPQKASNNGHSPKVKAGTE